MKLIKLTDKNGNSGIGVMDNPLHWAEDWLSGKARSEAAARAEAAAEAAEAVARVAEEAAAWDGDTLIPPTLINSVIEEMLGKWEGEVS